MRDLKLAQLDNFKADHAAALSDAQHYIARDLPPPPAPPYHLLAIAILIFVVAAFCYRRADFVRRWLLEPIARKTTRNAGALKRWWLEK